MVCVNIFTCSGLTWVWTVYFYKELLLGFVIDLNSAHLGFYASSVFLELSSFKTFWVSALHYTNYPFSHLKPVIFFLLSFRPTFHYSQGPWPWLSKGYIGIWIWALCGHRPLKMWLLSTKWYLITILLCRPSTQYITKYHLITILIWHIWETRKCHINKVLHIQ